LEQKTKTIKDYVIEFCCCALVAALLWRYTLKQCVCVCSVLQMK